MMKHSSFILSVLLFVAVASSCNIDQPGGSNARVADEMAKSPKRGVAFSFTNLMDLPLLTPAISWNYNWGNQATSDAAIWFDSNNVEFCPMCWNGGYSKDNIRAYVAAHPSTKYLLAFNEPNLTDQANMIPSRAAELWPDVLALAKELNLKLVSPAMNYGTLAGYSDPIKWLDEFLAQPGVSIDDIDAISIHCYMGSPSALINYVERFKKYGKPIWMTEFCAWENVSSVESQMNYMCAVLNYFEQASEVERYAWFIPRYKTPGTYPYMQLLTSTASPELTDLGRMYVMFSSFDKKTWLSASRFIHAGEYMATSDNNIIVRPTTDQVALANAGRDGLMVINFTNGQSLSYQVYTVATGELVARATGFSDCIAEICVDGKSVNFMSLPRTGSVTDFQSSSVAVPLSAGKHTITISMTAGSCYFSGFELK